VAPAAHAGRSGHRTRSRTATAGGIRTARPTTLWPFADAEALPGTELLAGWLGRTILTLVTTYTRPGDRVLLLTPPPLRTPSRAPGRTHGRDPYAGLAEAVWTVARLGRGVDSATAMLRHSSITVTTDVDTTVLPEVALAAAEATAKIIPRTATRQLGLVSGTLPTIVDGQEAEEGLPDNTKPQVTVLSDLGSEGAPSGTRTPNPLVKRTRFGVSGGAE
jgi:hypothetical protein